MIKRRDKTYGVRIYRDGKQVWVGSYRTLADARAAERDALTKKTAANAMTVAEWVTWWRENMPRPRASTNRHNAERLKAFVADFGNRQMDDITPMEATVWAKAHTGNYPVVRTLYNDAKRNGVVTGNPFAELGIDSSKGRKNIQALTEQELHDLADLSLEAFGGYGPTFRAVVLFAGYVGLRPAELFCLRWGDIDFAAHTVRVNKSLGSTGEVTLPKNGDGRTVVLPPRAAAALREMPRRTDSPYVFTTATGERFSKTSHYYYWARLRDAARLYAMDFYELRHFCATELLRRGARPADVAVQLGHTDGGILVMQLYGHPEEDDARARVLAAFSKEKPKLRAV